MPLVADRNHDPARVYCTPPRRILSRDCTKRITIFRKPMWRVAERGLKRGRREFRKMECAEGSFTSEIFAADNFIPHENALAHSLMQE